MSTTASDGTTTPGGIFVTDTNLNPIIQVVTWLLLAITTVMLCFRLLTRFFLTSNHLWGLEEMLIVSAYLFGLGQSITWLVPQGKIFGRSLSEISRPELQDGLKAAYVGNILTVLSLGFAKLSVCMCCLTLSVELAQRRVMYTLASVLVLWTISSVFAAAFICGSHPWDQPELRCQKLQPFLAYLGISNALTDFLLMGIPAAIIYSMTSPLLSRLTIIAVFASRILAIAPALCAVAYLPRLMEDDYTLQGFPYYLSTLFAQSASVSTACIVYLRPLLRSLKRPYGDRQYEVHHERLSINLSQGLSSPQTSRLAGGTHEDLSYSGSFGQVRSYQARS